MKKKKDPVPSWLNALLAENKRRIRYTVPESGFVSGQPYACRPDPDKYPEKYKKFRDEVDWEKRLYEEGRASVHEGIKNIASRIHNLTFTTTEFRELRDYVFNKRQGVEGRVELLLELNPAIRVCDIHKVIGSSQAQICKTKIYRKLRPKKECRQ